MTATPEPIAPDLFGTEPQPHLIGSTCDNCGVTTFPAQLSCPRCAGVACTRRPLGRRGKLWTWTLQGFAPKAPYVEPATGFAPFVVGYLDIPGEVRAIGRVVDVDLRDLRIGMALEVDVRVEAFADGETALTYCFAPEDTRG